MKTFIDLFCGLGGFRIAMEDRGYECVFSSDIDETIRDLYQSNFGEKPQGDITGIAEKDIPGHDVLCAGFPCQDFSISGKREGLGGQSGTLFHDVVRIARHPAMEEPGVFRVCPQRAGHVVAGSPSHARTGQAREHHAR